MTERLSRKALGRLPGDVLKPDFVPAEHGAGIVHFGVGAFHRAHQAVYTDAAIAAAGGDWRIDGISPRSTDIADSLNAQDGLFTLIERGEGARTRIVGSIRRVVAAAREPGSALAALTDPATRIVSTTVTEKGYGIDRAARGIDKSHPAVAADLENPRSPKGVLGLIVEALRLRRESGSAAFTVLCCDNLPDNGGLLAGGVRDFARRTDPALADWIADNVAFPSTMVDRITPAPTAQTLEDAQRLTGFRDEAAVETEVFSQWVIEDRFPAGRPAWEAGGALFVDDVAPYEEMKLRMLNGTHSLMAYAGFLSGRSYVRDVMRDAALARLARRHLQAAGASLKPLAAIDVPKYAEELLTRFRNPAIAHATRQIAMDGTEKLPQRMFAPALQALAQGREVRPFAFAIAAWMRYCLGRTDTGETYTIDDPRAEAIAAALARAGGGAASIVAALQSLPGFVPESLAGDPRWTNEVNGALAAMLEKGVRGAVEDEARSVAEGGAA